MANTTNLKTCLVMSVFLLAIVSTAGAEIIYVDNDAPNDQEPNNPDISDPNEDGSPEHPFDAIQEGINAAFDGDTVIVLEGTYTGTGNRDIDFGGRAITVRSTDPNDPNVVAATIVDCNGDPNNPHRGFYFHSGEDANSVLNGLTITGGYAEEGGGIYCDGVATKITNCLIYGNSADYGGGIYRKNTVSEVSNCIIRDNYALEGGGVYSYGDPYFIQGYETITYELFGRIYTKIRPVFGSGKFANCEIKDNSADKGGGIYYEDSVSEISDCIIVNNNADYGGGIKCNNASLELINNTIAENTAIYSGGGIYCVGPNSTAATANCILWDNTAADGNEIALYDSSAIDVNYCDVKGGATGVYVDANSTLNWGNGNIDADPCFVLQSVTIQVPAKIWDPITQQYYIGWLTLWIMGDYHLLPDSPCIDAGDPNYVPGPNETDIDGDPRIINGRVDMGADESTYPPKPNLIFVKDLYEFNVAAGQVHQFTVDINNVDNVSHDLSGLSIVEQVEGLSVRFMEPGVTQPVSVSAGEMFSAALEVDATDAVAGSTYSLWAKCLTDGDPQRADYTELRFAVVLDVTQPDLEITSEDITFEPLPGEPSQPVTISATIRNIGAATAEDVVVSFKDFDSTIGTSMVIPIILPGDSNAVSIQHTWPDASFRLITVTADPNDAISELDETNNSGSKVYQVGAVPEMEASIMIVCSTPAGFPEGTIATISGEAFYEIRVAHQGDYVYLPANSSSVSVRIIYSSGENELPRLFTDMQGRFTVSFPVPGQADDMFDVVITVTDGFLESVWQKRFDVYEPNPRKDIWVYSEDITFDINNPSLGETINIEAVIHASPDNTKKEPNVPVTFYAHHPTLGTFSIDSTQYIAQMPPGTNESVDANWTNGAEGIYCIEVALEPGFSDDNNGNNRASRPLVVGPAPQSIDVLIEAPLENADVNASDTTLVTVLVTDNHGNVMIPCVFDSLNLQFSGVDGRRVDLKRYFNWSSSRYVYPWRPPTDANGQACLEVTAQTIDILGSVLTDSNSTCVNVVDNAPPTFWVGCSPRSAMAGQVVHITVNTSEPLLNDQLDSITVTDSNGQAIPLDPCDPEHPWSTRWVYQTEPLPMETAKGTATITVTGRDMRLNAGSGEGHFAVVTGDLWIYSQDITFSDSNPDLGETITIGAVIHSSSDNTATVGQVPVTFYANHTVVGIYTKIGRTLYIEEISPGDNYLVSTTWRNAAEGAYIIKATIGPEFSDDNNGNNVATRVLFVGTECDFTDDGEVDFGDLAIFAGLWLWGGQAGSIPQDIINDGTVNFGDFAKLAGNWMK